MNATWWPRWVAEGKRIEWRKHEKMLPGKDCAFFAAEPSAGVGQLLIEGVYEARHRDDGLAWLWIVRASVAFVQHCDFGCAEISEKKWLHVFVANVWKWMDRFCVEAWRHL